MLLCIWHNLRRQHSYNRAQTNRSKILFAVPRADTSREFSIKSMQHQTSLHSIRWQTSIRRVHFVHGLG